MSTTVHRPRTGQLVILTITPSDLCPDMRDVASSIMKLRRVGSNPIMMDASLANQSEESVNVVHVWDEEANEAQLLGRYSIWSECTRSSGVVVQSEPYVFNIIEDSDTAG